MESIDLREVQSAITKMILRAITKMILRAITKMILRADPSFLFLIDRTLMFEDKVLTICKDKRTLEWAKHVLEANAPSLVGHQGYDAKGPKDLPPAIIFRIWLPENEGLSITDTLKLASCCNAKITCKDLVINHSAKGDGGVLHVASVWEPSLTLL